MNNRLSVLVATLVTVSLLSTGCSALTGPGEPAPLPVSDAAAASGLLLPAEPPFSTLPAHSMPARSRKGAT